MEDEEVWQIESTDEYRRAENGRLERAYWWIGPDGSRHKSWEYETTLHAVKIPEQTEGK